MDNIQLLHTNSLISTKAAYKTESNQHEIDHLRTPQLVIRSNIRWLYGLIKSPISLFNECHNSCNQVIHSLPHFFNYTILFKKLIVEQTVKQINLKKIFKLNTKLQSCF